MPLPSHPVFPAHCTKFHEVFISPYDTTSNEYQDALSRVQRPWTYLKVFVRYEIQRHPVTPRNLVAGRPVTITLNHPNLAYFGLVREVHDFESIGNFPWVNSNITIEVHTLPDFPIDWSATTPWPHPAKHTTFILPHCFLEDSYVLQPLNDIPEDEFIEVQLCLEVASLEAEEMLSMPSHIPQEHLPPSPYSPRAQLISRPIYLSNYALPLDELPIPHDVAEVDENLVPLAPHIIEERENMVRDMTDGFAFSIESCNEDGLSVQAKVEEVDSETERSFLSYVGTNPPCLTNSLLFAGNFPGNDNHSSPATSSSSTIVVTHCPNTLSSLYLPARATLALPPPSLPSPPRPPTRRRIVNDFPPTLTPSGEEGWEYSIGGMY